MEETTKVQEGQPVYDSFLPDAIQVLVEWIILLFSTLMTYLGLKEESEG